MQQRMHDLEEEKIHGGLTTSWSVNWQPSTVIRLSAWFKTSSSSFVLYFYILPCYDYVSNFN